jgi:hypothetical protein
MHVADSFTADPLCILNIYCIIVINMWGSGEIGAVHIASRDQGIAGAPRVRTMACSGIAALA